MGQNQLLWTNIRNVELIFLVKEDSKWGKVVKANLHKTCLVEANFECRLELFRDLDYLVLLLPNNRH